MGDSVGSAGDFNHDGHADVLVGDLVASPYGRHRSGAVFAVYGKTTTAPVDVKRLAGKGFRIAGDRWDGSFGSNGLDHAALCQREAVLITQPTRS